MARLHVRSPAEFLVGLSHVATDALRHAGDLGTLLWQMAYATATGRVSMREVIRQAFQMGVQSVPLVIVTGILSGVVTSQQGGYQFTGNVPLYIVGAVVGSSVILELGPVMTAFVMVGRVGARITAEIGTMQVSEQIDALHSLGRDPVRMLGAPRLIAGLFVMPVLVGIADLVGLFAGLFTAQRTLALGADTFLYGVRLYFHDWDLFYSLAKAAAFGFVIPLISVHMGLSTHGGAEGVGKATTHSVVFMIVCVLVLDALFPPLLLN
ncbi:MAG TPA: ABC transporter permease [Myxococcales bacterium]|jgi:phospholipid/cholesterol/gamma-HCH transport system permease protein